MSVSPFRITAWSKAFTRVGLLGDPDSVTLTPRHNQQPTGQITLRSEHQLAPRLLTEGCRLTVDYYGQQVMSGLVDSIQGTASPSGLLTVQLRDDWCLLTDLLGWPVPTAAISAQAAAEYDTKTGPAETVLKWFAGRAITRLGLPVTVAPDLGRGSTITVQMRMNALADNLFPLVDQAGIGTSVRQVGAGLVLDCYAPAAYPRTLTPRSGVVTDWEWSRAAPKATRVVVGGQGDKTARVFRERVDTAAESLWGIKREAFLDATDVATSAMYDARGDALLAEQRATAGLRLSLAETDTFRYGQHLTVGDQVTTQLVPNADPITDILREATISWSAHPGPDQPALTVVPVVGERSDDPDRILARAVTSIARAVRTDRSNR